MRPRDLVAGNCYFTVAFWDADMLFPMIDTLRYVGCEETPDGTRWLFEEPPSIGKSDVNGDERARLLVPEDQLHGILEIVDLPRAIAEVQPDHPIAPVTPQPAPEADLGGLASAIRRLLDGRGSESLTITIRYTDAGVSLTKDESGGLLLMVFPRPRFNPELEPKLRTLFGASGLLPERDYLSNRGRVRVLAYAVQPDVDALVAVCRRVFKDVYGMRAGDTLRYHWRTERRGAAEQGDEADEAG